MTCNKHGPLLKLASCRWQDATLHWPGVTGMGLRSTGENYFTNPPPILSNAVSQALSWYCAWMRLAAAS